MVIPGAIVAPEAVALSEPGIVPFPARVPAETATLPVNVLVVNPSFPVNSVKDLIAVAKAKPGTLNYGSGGSGTPAHLTGALDGGTE